MATQPILARSWLFEVESTTTGTWIVIKGVKQFSPGDEATRVNTDDFSTDGWETHLVAGRKATLELEGQYYEDPATGDRDPGQQRVEVIGNKIGNDSHGKFRVTSPGGTTKTFLASATVNSGGGGTNDVGAWKASLEASGPITGA
jgi:hypothetical protein